VVPLWSQQPEITGNSVKSFDAHIALIYSGKAKLLKIGEIS
jgi:hypothetical protein